MTRIYVLFINNNKKMKGSQDISLYIIIIISIFSFSFLFFQMFLPYEELSPCEKINKYVPNLKLNCDELNIAPNYITIEEINTKKILDDEREKLLNYIKSLKEE